MAGYGYGSWSQVAAPKASSSEITAIGSAGDLFDKALTAGRETAANYDLFQAQALEKARNKNLENLKLRLQGAAAQGLEAYDPLQDQMTGQNIQATYGDYIDPLAAAQAAQMGREAAVSQTTKNLLSKSDQQWNQLQSSNLTALQKAAEELPDASQYLVLDPSGSLVETQAAATPEGKAAVNQFAEVAKKYGFQPIDAPLQIRRNLEERLAGMGAEAQEIRNITDTFEKYQSDRSRLDAESKGALDVQVNNLTNEYQTALDNVDKLETDFFTQNGMSLGVAKKLGEASSMSIPEVVRKYFPDDTVLIGNFGGEELIQRIQELRSKGYADITNEDGTTTRASLKGITDEQIIYAMLNVGETDNLIFDEAVPFDKFVKELLVTANGGPEDAVIRQRAAAYNDFASQKASLTDQYNANVSAVSRAIKNQAGFQDTKENSRIIQAALARATQVKGSPLTAAEKKEVTSDAKTKIQAATQRAAGTQTTANEDIPGTETIPQPVAGGAQPSITPTGGTTATGLPLNPPRINYPVTESGAPTPNVQREPDTLLQSLQQNWLNQQRPGGAIPSVGSNLAGGESKALIEAARNRALQQQQQADAQALQQANTQRILQQRAQEQAAFAQQDQANRLQALNTAYSSMDTNTLQLLLRTGNLDSVSQGIIATILGNR